MINFPDAPSVNQRFSIGTPLITWLWDGAKWVVSDINEGTSISNPSDGDVLVLTEVRPYYINNASTLASLTIRLPGIAAVDDVLDISFRSPVTTLTVQDSLGITISNMPHNAYGPGAGLVFRYVDASIRWVYWK